MEKLQFCCLLEFGLWHLLTIMVASNSIGRTKILLMMKNISGTCFSFSTWYQSIYLSIPLQLLLFNIVVEQEKRNNMSKVIEIRTEDNSSSASHS